MKYLYFILLLLLSASTSTAQLEIKVNPDSGLDANDRLRINFTVYNRGTETETFFWALETTPATPTEWAVGEIYDQIICYVAGSTAALCGPDFVNTIAAGDSVLYYSIGVDVYDTFDDGCITYRLLDACSPEATDTLSTINFKFDSEFVSSQNSPQVNPEVQIYPNPFTDNIRLSGDEGVTSILVYDMRGRLVKSLVHRPAKVHDLSALPNGTYIFNLVGMSNQQIKFSKLIKQ